MPLRYSRDAVLKAVPGLSPGISLPTCISAYTPFTPSKSGQRLPPTYYRGCWHVVSRGFLLGYRHYSSPKTEVYNPKTVFPHAALLHQACAHCAIFPTAASRRSLDRVSVPVWLVILSDQLGIVALVSRYPTNKLIPSGHIRWQEARRSPSLVLRRYAVLATVSSSYPPPSGSFPDITHPSATRQQRSKLLPVTVRLACVRPAASVQSEP